MEVFSWFWRHLGAIFLFLLVLEVTCSRAHPQYGHPLEAATKQISSSIKYTVNPCTDFYEFACGNWVNTQRPFKNEANLDYYAILKEKIAHNLKILLERRQMKESVEAIFYRACLDKDRINQLAHWKMAQLLYDSSGVHWPIVYPTGSEPNWQRLYSASFLLNVNSLFTLTFLENSDPQQQSQILLEPPEFDTSLLANPSTVFEIASLFASTQPGPLKVNSLVLHQRILELLSFELTLESLKGKASPIESAQMSLFTLDYETGFTLNWRDLLNAILRKSMRQLGDLVTGFEGTNQMKSDNQLIVQSIEVLTLAHQLARNGNISRENPHFGQKARLSKLLDHSQLALISQWTPGSETVRSFTHSPFFQQKDSLLVNDVAYFRSLATLLQATPAHILLNYMGWKVLSHYRNYLGGQAWRLLHRDDPRPERPLWRHCIDRLLKVYPWNASHQYLKHYVPVETKGKAMRLMDHSRAVFQQTIHRAAWIDSTTRGRALQKLASLKTYVSHPHWLTVEYHFERLKSQEDKTRDDLIDLTVRKLTFNRAWQFLLLRLTHLNDFHGWFEAPILVGAYNAPASNSISIPFAILQPPFFHLAFPDILNYGGIFHIMGHELTHTLDTTGSLIDSSGTMADWWTPLARQRFDRKALCFTRQYGQITEEITRLKINGYLTIGENIADNGALRIAYNAFKSQPAVARRLPFLEHFSRDQSFFLQYAQTFCGRPSARYLAVQLLTDTHAPEKIRVNVPLANLEAFSRAFGCPARSQMNSQYKCSLWR